MTKDERFLIELLKRGETATCKEMASALSLSEKQFKNILKGLMQANFIKRLSDEKITLTSRGVDVAQDLL